VVRDVSCIKNTKKTNNEKDAHMDIRYASLFFIKLWKLEESIIHFKNLRTYWSKSLKYSMNFSRFLCFMLCMSCLCTCFWIDITTNSKKETSDSTTWSNTCGTKTSYIHISTDQNRRRGWSMISNDKKLTINGQLIRVSMCSAPVGAL